MAIELQTPLLEEHERSTNKDTPEEGYRQTPVAHLKPNNESFVPCLKEQDCFEADNEVELLADYWLP